MTSRSRRKHPITAPNTTRAKAADLLTALGRPGRLASLLSGSALVVSTLFTSSYVLAEESQQLNWRSRRLPAAVQTEPTPAAAPAAEVRQVAAAAPVLELALNAPTNGEPATPAELPATAQASRPMPTGSATEIIERTASLPAGKPLVWGGSLSSEPSAAAPTATANRPTQLGAGSQQIAETHSETDPFADPFEDQSPAPIQQAAAPVHVAAATEAATVEPVQFENPFGDEDVDPFGNDEEDDGPQLGEGSAGGEYEAPTPQGPAFSEEYGPEPVPEFSPFDGAARPGQMPCDAEYNDRNTCEEAAACAQAWQTFEDRRLSDISLDITPGYPVDINNPNDTDALRQRQLADLESRPWRDREGEIVARGRLTNFYDGVVIVQNPSGTEMIPFRSLGDDELAYLNAWWRLPTECRIRGGIYNGCETYALRPWTETITYTWKASALCHKPLYFEDVDLERYGHSRGPLTQPLMSGAHFFLNLAIVPYRMGINPPTECQYALGYYRPGSCAPWMIESFPISPRGALYQAAAVTGAAFIIP